MKKIYIIGSVASGKTTLAKDLSQKSGIPYYELDCIIHSGTKKKRRTRTPEEQLKQIKAIDSTGAWIIEGTYRESCQCLLEMADQLIFLDTPLWKRRSRILLRFLKQQVGVERCQYKSDLRMLKLMYKWTAGFEQDRVQFEAMLSNYSSRLIVLKNPRDFVKGM